VDITPEMIAFARERFPALQFEARDVLALTGDAALHLRADYVLASGVFGLADWAFMGQAIQRMYALCEVGLAFNTLSAQAADREPGEFQADPGETLRFCQSLTPYVALRHDYMPHDFTVYMYRAQQFA
jgi:hypothetical protein